MPTEWEATTIELVRDAIAASRPRDVLAARFPWVPSEDRARFLTLTQAAKTGEDRELLVEWFAGIVDDWAAEERERSRSMLRRIWRLWR